jgi:hypothetical protein
MILIVSCVVEIARTCFVGPRGEGIIYPTGRVLREESLPLEFFVVLYMVVFSCILHLEWVLD